MKRTPERHLNSNHDLFDTSRYDEINQTAKVLSETIKKGKSCLDTFPELIEDLFYSAFKYAPSMKNAQDVDTLYQLNRPFVQEAISSPEWRELRARTRLDPLQSALAAASMGEAMLNDQAGTIAALQKHIKDVENARELLKQMEKEAAKIQSAMKKKGSSAQQAQLQVQQQVMQQKIQAQKAEVQVKTTSLQQGAGEFATCVASAIKQANAACEVHEALTCGWGSNTGMLVPVPYEERVKLSNAIIKNKKFREIAMLAGRMSRLASKKRKQKTKHSMEEIADITQGDDISRLIPTEAMLLVDPTLNLLFKKKFVERELLVYDLEGEEEKGKGPIIACFDVSGSMRDEKDTWCKAVTLALIQLAHKEKRDAVAIPFDSEVKTVFEFFTKDGFQAGKVLEMAGYFTGGGTDFDPPLKKAMEYLDRDLKDGDVVIITDGNGRISPEVSGEFESLKQRLKHSLMTIVIGPEYGYVQHSLKPISDLLYPVESLNDDLAGRIFEAM